MAVVFSEPRIEQCDLTGWSNFIERTAVQQCGACCIAVDNINTSELPAMKQGSRFEVNGLIYVVKEDEAILGSPTADTVNYIYAVPSGEQYVFMYKDIAPHWDAAKGGWFNGTTNERALVRFLFISDLYNNKVILDSYNAIGFINTIQLTPDFEGVLVAECAMNSTFNTILDVGIYRAKLKGSARGSGGAGGNGDDGIIAGGARGAGAAGQAINEVFELKASTIVNMELHGDGNNGGNGSNGKGGASIANAQGGSSGGGGGGGSGGYYTYSSGGGMGKVLISTLSQEAPAMPVLTAE